MASPAVVISRQCRRTGDCTQSAIVHCAGCFQLFCHAHFVDHRRDLEHHVNQLMNRDDRLQQLVEVQRDEFSRHPLFQEVDEWEKQSIGDIQRKANELQQQLVQLTSLHLDQLSHKIQHLKEELQKSYEQCSFIESDIRNWTKKLKDFEEDLTSCSMFSISGLTRNPLFQHVLVNIFEKNEFFHDVSNNKVRIEEYGQLAIHDASTAEIELRGKNEYTSGCHEIRLRIEKSTNNWMFVGINSKSTPLQNNSYATRSACGWATNNNFWCNGDSSTNTSTRIEMAMKDIIILIVDCENRKIFMINERTNGHYELQGNVDNCPFPWQLHVNRSTRILSA